MSEPRKRAARKPAADKPPAPRLKIEVRRVSELLRDPNNARGHNRRNIEAIQASLRRFDIQKPIVIDVKGIVIAGNGMLEAAEAEGWEWIEVVVSPLTGADATAYGITDNRTGELSEWITEQLAELLPTLPDDLLDVTGFDADEIAALLASGIEDLPVYEGDGEPGAQDGPFEIDEIIAEALTHYRTRGFPYPTLARFEIMQQLNQLAATADESLANTNAAYHVADGFHPQRFSTRCSGNITPVEAFERDDKLSHAFRLILENGGKINDGTVLSMLAWVRAAQMAAQFRPGYALSILRRFCPEGGQWLDTSAGYGGRLTAYAASHLGSYIGIDPSEQSVAGNTALAEALSTDGVTLIRKPAEDVKLDEVGGASSADIVFTSPPYFAKEAYADEPTQSFVRYPAPESWRTGFLVPMMALAAEAAKPEAHVLINIADVTIGDVTAPLVEWTRAAGKAAGLKLLGEESMPMPRTPGRGERPERVEPLIIFRKPKPTRSRKS